MIIVGYIYLYHKKKRKMTAIVCMGVTITLLILSTLFLIPTKGRETIVEEVEVPMKVKKTNTGCLAVCEDGTEYKVYSMNTKLTSGFYSYRNDKHHKNEKVEVTYRYDYRLWWFIPVYSMKHETHIYFDNDTFRSMYACDLEYK